VITAWEFRLDIGHIAATNARAEGDIRVGITPSACRPEHAVTVDAAERLGQVLLRHDALTDAPCAKAPELAKTATSR
jgi:hypothetical protein